MAVLYTAAGITHFTRPAMFLQIMPPWLPLHHFFVYFTGVLEILLGVLLMVPATRKTAAWGLIILLIAVFPANVQMMLNYKNQNHPLLWVSVARLPLQVLLVWWAWLYTKSRKPQRVPA
jgi:uncharacterized membrane protein